MQGYKGFNKGLICQPDESKAGFQFKEGEIAEIKGDLNICCNGLHFCKSPLDVFNYYPPIAGAEYASVDAVGDIVDKDDKSATNRLFVNAKLSIKRLFEIHFSFVKELCLSSTYANTAGYSAIASSLGIKSKAKAEKGAIVIADWRIVNNEWVLCGVHSALIGGKIKNKKIKASTWYWFEDGKLCEDQEVSA